MNKAASIYIDFIRFFSALLVLFFHAKYARFDGSWLRGIGAYGHDAVIIFFVLSGFVITYITYSKETSLWSFSRSRLARLYSVVIPALLLTLILDFAGKQIDPSIYTGGFYQNSQPITRFFANLFFVNEIWFESWRAFSNGPFWSLSYEFWYYVIYATIFYFSGAKRILLFSIAIIIAGPKILLLFPVWLFGAYVYHATQKNTLRLFHASCLTFLPIAIYFLLRDFEVPKHLLQQTIEYFGRDFLYNEIKWSRRFLNDYIVGGLFAIHLFGVIALVKNINIPILIEKPIRYFAGTTFALYLLHYPLLQFFGSIFDNGRIIVSLTFISVLLLAPFTEGKKKEWNTLLERWKNLSGNFLRKSMQYN